MYMKALLTLQTDMSETCLPQVNDSAIVKCFYGAGNQIDGDQPEFMAGRWSARCNYTKDQAEMRNISATVSVIESICPLTTTETGMVYKNTMNN